MYPRTELLHKLQLIEARRQDRTWQPVKPNGTPNNAPHTSLIRSLMLRKLEIPVKLWTNHSTLSLGYALGPDITSILESHAMDEDKHDTQLDWLARYWGIPSLEGDHQETYQGAQKLMEQWLDLPCEPIVKKMCLESGVFFPILGMMSVYSRSDLFTQSVRQWITSDENAHVASSRLIIKHLGLKIPRLLNTLVEDTIDWLTENLPTEDQARWKRLSYQGMRTGQFDSGDELSTVSVPESFTQAANNRIPYQIHRAS